MPSPAPSSARQQPTSNDYEPATYRPPVTAAPREADLHDPVWWPAVARTAGYRSPASGHQTGYGSAGLRWGVTRVRAGSVGTEGQ